MKKIILLTLLSFPFYTMLSAQTGPGGVRNATDNQIWVDPMQMDYSNNENVLNFNESSGNNNSIFAQYPNRAPVFSTNVVNARHTLFFSGYEWLFSNDIAAFDNSEELSWIVVGQTTNMSANNAHVFFSNSYNPGDASINKRQLLSFMSSNTLYSMVRGNPTIKNQTPVNENQFYISSNIWNNDNTETFVDGVSVGSTSTPILDVGTHRNIGIGRSAYLNSYHLTGDVAEVIVYSDDITETERIIIENYLSSKYNISISSSGNDFYAYDNNHSYELFGIGQLNGQSSSDARGSGFVRINNANDLQNNEFMLIGHNDISLDNFSTNVPAIIPNSERWERTWRVDETGSVGTHTVAFDLDTIGFGSPTSSYRLLIDDDGDFSDAQVANGSFNSANNTVTFTGVDFNDGDYFTLAARRAIISENGGGNWDDPLAWNCFCVPSPQDSVIVDAGDVINVNLDTAVKSMLVRSNGTLNLAGNNLDIGESLRFDGALTPNGGRLTFNGSVNARLNLGGQTIGFNDLTMAMGSNSLVINNGNLELNGLLALNSGTLADGSASIIINSTSATNSGDIGAISPSVTINEPTFTVHRFVPEGTAGKRDISSPINNAQVTQLDDDFEISGAGMPDGCASSSSGCYASLKYYDGSAGSYVDVHNVTHTLVTGRGYEMWFGDDLDTFSQRTYDMIGSLNPVSDINVNVDTWSIVGNPYASAIDFNQLALGGSVGNYFYIYDVAIEGFQWYDGTAGTASSPDLSGGIIAQGQGFWVENTGSVTFSQSAKVSSGETYLRSEKEVYQLEVNQVDGGKKSDFSFMIDPMATKNRDASDIPNFPRLGDHQEHIIFGSLTEYGEMLRLNKIGGYETKTTIPLVLNVANEGAYTISSKNFEKLEVYNCVRLYDSKTDQTTEMTADAGYTFEMEETNTNAERFTLLLNKNNCQQGSSEEAASLGENALSNNIDMVQRDRLLQFNMNLENKEKMNVDVVNTLGQKVMPALTWSVQEGRRELQVPENIHGTLIIRLQSATQQFTRKIFVK